MMTEDLVVRRAKVEDAHDLADLATRSFRDAYAGKIDAKTVEDYLGSSFTPENIRGELDDAANVFLLAYREGQDAVIGYAKMSTTSEPEHRRSEHCRDRANLRGQISNRAWSRGGADARLSGYCGGS